MSGIVGVHVLSVQEQATEVWTVSRTLRVFFVGLIKRKETGHIVLV